MLKRVKIIDGVLVLRFPALCLPCKSRDAKSHGDDDVRKRQPCGDKLVQGTDRALTPLADSHCFDLTFPEKVMQDWLPGRRFFCKIRTVSR